MTSATLLTVSCLLAASGGQVVRLAEPNAVQPYGTAADYTFTAPADYDAARLTVTLRMDFPDLAGSTYVLHMTLNGHAVSPVVDRRRSRLVNKPGSYRHSQYGELTWYRGAKWRVLYAPDFVPIHGLDRNGKRVRVKDPFTAVIDITDFVRRGQSNTLHLAHIGKQYRLKQIFKKLKPSLDFHLRELSVRFLKGVEPVTVSAKEPTDGPLPLRVDPPSPLDPKRVCRFKPDGAVEIALPGLPARLVSRYSVPGAGFNAVPAAGKGEAGWRPKLTREGQGYVLTAAGRHYKLQRTVAVEAHRLVFSDRLTNLTDQAIGVRLDNQVRVPERGVTNVFLGGNPDPARTSLTRFENTSLVIEGERSGLGLLMLDDVCAVQCAIHYDQGVGGFRTDSFALAPKASYTVRWAVYPLAEPSYFDFVNLARRDLGANVTIPGGFSFFSAGWALKTPEKELREWIEQRDIRILSSPVWFDRRKDAPARCYHGGHMLSAAHNIEQLRQAVVKLHRAAPGVKVIIYIHAHINTDPAGPKKFPDAHVTNADGSHYLNQGYTKRIGIPFYYYYPTRTNSYLPAMKRVADMCFEQIGADGVYWDEMAWVSPTHTYSEWDGHSADIDPKTNTLKRKNAYIGLISLEAKEALARHILAKGVLVGNSNPVAPRMHALRFPRFVETASEWYPARAHLYTPIALGDHHTVKSFDTLLDDIRLKLEWGTVYYYYRRPAQPYATITKHMFPFTPVELHKGWLVGKERIITCRRGRYTFGDDRPVRVYWFDAKGKQVDRPAPATVEAGRRVVDLDLGPKEMAVIERR